ncbi:MAG: DEAD/DEAH box helicase [Desulfobulbales bacterium]|nr:DEAD/DEAH box helicase [Desulfobulbales bacterium]
MRKNPGKKGGPLSARQQFLDSPVHILPLPPRNGEQLNKMGFTTVKEAFRAALTGRISSRKNGGADLENRVITTGCTALGHPELTRTDLKDFQPATHERTVADAIFRLNGCRVRLSDDLLATSIRNILLPATMHKAIDLAGISTLAELLGTHISALLNMEGMREMNLGLFLAHIFDYVFILHEQENPAGGFNPDILHDSTPAQGNAATFSFAPAPEDEEIRQSGRKMLREERMQFFMFFRNAVGAVFREGARSGIACLSLDSRPETPPERQIITADCEMCPATAETRPGHCPHIAALILKITERFASQTESLPSLPFRFASGPWHVVGQIIHELFGRDQMLEVVCAREGADRLLTIPDLDGHPWVTWRLDRETMAVTSALFGRRQKWLDHKPGGEVPPEVVVLRETLVEMGRTAAEIELNSFGKRSPAQERDESIWMWLAASQCRDIPAGNLRITGPGGDGLFSLVAASPADGRELFRMIIPRAKTPEVIDALHRGGKQSLLLPAARALTRMGLAENGDMLALSLLRLADGRIFNRHDLKERQYGHYYYLENEGFLPVLEQDPGHTVPENTGGRPAIFHADKVPELLRQYSRAITAPENEIDPDLLALDFIAMPDRLEVGSFAADDDWCYLSGHYGLGSRHISLAELLSARIVKKRFMPGGDKWLKLTDSPLEWFHDLGEERLWRDERDKVKGVRLTRREMIMLSALIPDLRLKRNTKGRGQLLNLLDTDRWREEDLPCKMPEHLRDYQRHGVSWLYHLYRNGLAGILADDMGLGKTHQALALLQAILAKDKEARFLIVCPATVVPHWVEKIEKFFPDLSHYVYHGSRRDLDKANGNNIYITTYGIIRRDAKTLAEPGFGVIIFDEIQNLKNRKTDAYKAAARLDGRIVIGMTGTPLENSAHDLKSIFDICLPGYLGSNRDFKAKYLDPLETDKRDDAKESLARLINPFMLRRTREQVLTELPEIIEDIRTCELSGDQISLYRELTSGRVRTIMQMVSADQDEGRLPYMELLAVINYLKQICNHPCLLKDCTDPTRFRSGKWDLFVELLDECLESGIKVVIFSHYTRMLDLIEHHLTAHNISFCGLRGNMPMGVRHQMIKRFNTDDSCRVFSASLLAGGVGVDLTAAQAVIHYDRWWNAAREDQATARVHRMGQKNVVQVFKLITIGTLEEKINQMIAKKKDLANHLVREDDAAIIKKLSRSELLELLSEPAGRNRSLE